MTCRALIFLTFSFGTALVSGCATIIHGTTQEVPVATTPPAATLTVVGQPQTYTTPTKVTLKRNQNHILQFGKDGYEPTSFTLQSVISGAVAGNIIAGGLIGWGIDAASGAQYKLVPEEGNVTLKPLAGPSAQPAAPAPIVPLAGRTLEERLRELQSMRERNLLSEEEYQSLRRREIEGRSAPQPQGEERKVAPESAPTQSPKAQ